MSEGVKPKELCEYMGAREPEPIPEWLEEFRKKPLGPPVKSLPEVFRELGEALGVYRRSLYNDMENVYI